MTPRKLTIIRPLMVSQDDTNADACLKTATNCSSASSACCGVRATRTFAARALASSHAETSVSLTSAAAFASGLVSELEGSCDGTIPRSVEGRARLCGPDVSPKAHKRPGR